MIAELKSPSIASIVLTSVGVFRSIDCKSTIHAPLSSEIAFGYGRFGGIFHKAEHSVDLVAFVWILIWGFFRYMRIFVLCSCYIQALIQSLLCIDELKDML